MTSTPHFEFKGSILTDVRGYEQLGHFFRHASKFRNCQYRLDWNGLIAMDANLTSILMGMMHLLKNGNGLHFFLDMAFLRGELNVFYRNGFANYVLGKPQEKPDDQRKSTIRVKATHLTDPDNFITYIEQEFLAHRGLEDLSHTVRRRFKDCYLEIFCNADLHAATDKPVLTCGQYYPKSKELKFTFVDLGQGFLPKIEEYTRNTDTPIKHADRAISWAVRGGTTKTEAPGGSGLSTMLTYCRKNNGSLHIVTSGCYWYFDQDKIYSFALQNPFLGTTIHLIFRL